MWRFMDWLNNRGHGPFDSYAALHAWSVKDAPEFWTQLWEFAGVAAETRGEVACRDPERMPGARWFPEARLSFAENLLRRQDDALALIYRGENGHHEEWTFAQLYAAVSRMAAALQAAGVAGGDRVAAIVANTPDAVVGMLAASSLGAVWSSCSPDFGVDGILDRFGQIEPKVLLLSESHWFKGRSHAGLGRLAGLQSGLPTLERVVVLPYPGSTPAERRELPSGACWLEDFLAPHAAGPIAFQQLPFEHPLYILFSSGTTGKPKCIVHGAGGTLLQHLKEHRLHSDVRPGDRLFYFTTCGWMMWNWLVSALASEATLVLYDGSPLHPSWDVLFDLAEDAGVTHFGTSARYIDALRKAGGEPRHTHDLNALRVVLSTGSPLSPEAFAYVYDGIKEDLQLASISGGTDIVSCFALGNPTGPVWSGELQAPGLGMRVAVFDQDGKPCIGLKGELVCTAPFPSMPVGFWNDPDQERYLAAYFARYPNVWHHGDYAEITSHGGLIIHGRSDATLNPGGVRVGTAEIYRQVERFEEVLESVAVEQEFGGGSRIVLFVKLRDGARLDDAFVQKLRTTIRTHTTSHHVPARIVAVADIPRTKSGKISELAVRNAIHNRPVGNLSALENPESLDSFRNSPELSE
jgi:acetoacetyl-CoA synthetase